jgi:hypothetical protein
MLSPRRCVTSPRTSDKGLGATLRAVCPCGLDRPANAPQCWKNAECASPVRDTNAEHVFSVEPGLSGSVRRLHIPSAPPGTCLVSERPVDLRSPGLTEPLIDPGEGARAAELFLAPSRAIDR